MTNRPKAIGTAGETAMCRWLQAHGIPAERNPLYGSQDRGDASSPGVCWESKAGKAAETASDGQVAKWLAETERERAYANACYGVLVMKRAGIGTTRAGEWWAVMTADSYADLIREAATDGEDLSYGFPSLAYGKPVRVHLATVALLLRAAGYGDELTEQEITA